MDDAFEKIYRPIKMNGLLPGQLMGFHNQKRGTSGRLKTAAGCYNQDNGMVSPAPGTTVANLLFTTFPD